MNDPPGPLIGKGRHADVYDLGGGRVLRRYRDDRDTATQVVAMRAAAAAGFPVPAVIEANGGDLVMEQVSGPTMLAEMTRRPWRIGRYAHLLADLHDRLHRIEAPAALERPFGRGDRLLHLDLQPENVILDPKRGAVLLDWEWAAAGTAETDVAHTWLEVATSEVPSTRWRRGVAGAGRHAFLRAFLARFDRQAVEAQMEAVRAYRLGKRELTPGETAAVAAFTVGP